MKFLIPLAIVAGIAGAIYTFTTFSKIGQRPANKQEAATETPPTTEERSSSVAPLETKEPNITFKYKKSDPLLSTPNQIYSSPESEYISGRANTDGYTEQVQDGIAIVKPNDTDKTYIISDAGRPEHKIAELTHYHRYANYTIIYADCDESHEPDPFSGLDGLFVGKTISYGYITQANTTKVQIKRLDGGNTFITFTKHKSELSPNTGIEEDTQAVPYTTIQPPKAIDKPEAGGVPPSL